MRQGLLNSPEEGELHSVRVEIMGNVKQRSDMIEFALYLDVAVRIPKNVEYLELSHTADANIK